MDEALLVNFPSIDLQAILVLDQEFLNEHGKSAVGQLDLVKDRLVLEQIPGKPAETQNLKLNHPKIVFFFEIVMTVQTLKHIEFRLKFHMIRNQIVDIDIFFLVKQFGDVVYHGLFLVRIRAPEHKL